MSKELNNNMHSYHKTLIVDIKTIINNGISEAYEAVNYSVIKTYWNIGKRIIEEEQNGKSRAQYGKEIINALSNELISEFGKGYNERNLRYYRQFYLMFPEQSIWNACVPNLTWTHFRLLLRVKDDDARFWYMNEAANEGWSSRVLDRNIGTQYYYRLLKAPKRDAVEKGLKKRTNLLVNRQFELIKSPMIAEFLGFKNENTYLESDLES